VSAPLRVVVGDDHPMFRFGLCAALAGTPEVEVVGQAADGDGLLALVDGTDVDVVLTDLEMPGTDGLTVAAELARTRPDVPVLVLTMHDDERAVRAAIESGAKGYLLKGAEKEEITSALMCVAAGGTVYGSGVGSVVRALMSGPAPTSQPLPQLTPREREVLVLVSSGLGNHAVGRALGLSEKTVRNHVSNILVKLRVPSRAAAVALARDAGLGASAGPGRSADQGPA
jgi:DNA-binding NarL/FixJ family response regulator